MLKTVLNKNDYEQKKRDQSYKLKSSKDLTFSFRNQKKECSENQKKKMSEVQNKCNRISVLSCQLYEIG